MWFRKYGFTLFLVFWFLGFTIYFGGYFFGTESGENRLFHAFSSLFSAIFSAGRIMAMELDLRETGRLAEYEIYQVLCSSIVFAAILLLGTALLSNIGGGVIGRIRLLFLKTTGTRRNVYFVYGLSQETVYLIEDIRRHDTRATILILQSRSEYSEQKEQQVTWQNDALQYGAARILLPSGKTLNFLVHVAGKCRRHIYVILMNTVQWKNAAMIREFCILQDWRKMPRVHFYVLYEREKSERIAQRTELQGWDIHWISNEELAARHVLMQPCILDFFPTEDCHDGYIGRDLRLAVIGYSKTAEELCYYLASCLQTAGMRICIDWFDGEICQKAAWFRVSRPELCKAASFEFLETEPGSGEFYQYFLDENHLPDAVFLACADSGKNAVLSLQMKDLLTRQNREQISVFARMDSIYEDQTALEAAGIHSFGCREQIYSYEVLIGEKLDIVAKAVHCYYKNFYGKIGDTENFWKEAGVYERQASRIHAVHIPWKLKCAGFQMEKGTGNTVFEKELAGNPKLFQNLSVGEHMRWEARLFLEGWRTARLEELPSKQNRDERKKLHACLVPWEELAAVERHYGVCYRDLDRHLVEALPDILARVGYQIKKF